MVKPEKGLSIALDSHLRHNIYNNPLRHCFSNLTSWQNHRRLKVARIWPAPDTRLLPFPKAPDSTHAPSRDHQQRQDQNLATWILFHLLTAATSFRSSPDSPRMCVWSHAPRIGTTSMRDRRPSRGVLEPSRIPWFTDEANTNPCDNQPYGGIWNWEEWDTIYHTKHRELFMRALTRSLENPTWHIRRSSWMMHIHRITSKCWRERWNSSRMRSIF